MVREKSKPRRSGVIRAGNIKAGGKVLMHGREVERMLLQAEVVQPFAASFPLKRSDAYVAPPPELKAAMEDNALAQSGFAGFANRSSAAQRAADRKAAAFRSNVRDMYAVQYLQSLGVTPSPTNIAKCKAAFPIPDKAIREYYSSMGWSKDYVMVDPGPLAKPDTALSLNRNYFSYFGAGKAVDAALKEAALDKLLFDNDNHHHHHHHSPSPSSSSNNTGKTQIEPETRLHGGLHPALDAHSLANPDPLTRSALAVASDRRKAIRRGMRELNKVLRGALPAHQETTAAVSSSSTSFDPAAAIVSSLLGGTRETALPVLDNSAHIPALGGSGGHDPDPDQPAALVEAELIRPIKVSRKELRDMGSVFTEMFPFEMFQSTRGSLPITSRDVDAVVVALVDQTTIELIATAIRFLCFALIVPIAQSDAFVSARLSRPLRSPAQSATETTELFVELVTRFVELELPLRRSANYVTFHVPLVLLCVKTVTESYFRKHYPATLKAHNGLLDDLTRTLSYVFDPSQYRSHIAVFQTQLVSETRHGPTSADALLSLMGIARGALSRTAAKKRQHASSLDAPDFYQTSPALDVVFPRLSHPRARVIRNLSRHTQGGSRVVGRTPSKPETVLLTLAHNLTESQRDVLHSVLVRRLRALVDTEMEADDIRVARPSPPPSEAEVAKATARQAREKRRARKHRRARRLSKRSFPGEEVSQKAVQAAVSELHQKIALLADIRDTYEDQAHALDTRISDLRDSILDAMDVEDMEAFPLPSDVPRPRRLKPFADPALEVVGLRDDVTPLDLDKAHE